MTKRKVISPKCLPTRIPVVGLAVIYLLLDKWGIPGWAWGVYGTLAAFLCTALGYFRAVEEVDIQLPTFGPQDKDS